MRLNVEFEVPTWDEIYEMLLSLAEKIQKDNFCPDLIIGICRGGWPPARVMSDLLGNPKLANISVEFYVDIARTRNKPILTEPVSLSVEGKKVLILDDVADTGKTLELVKNHLINKGVKRIKIATIYYKPWSIVRPDYYEKKTRKWIVFPWERKETVRNLMRKYRKEEVRKKLIEGGMDPKLLDRFISEVLKEKDPATQC
ncbi:phosphoribosyltransferase [Candidatus Bathyarchaeota archaeon]|nr:MAG: phosphoribosyltransferase [Candidatus Bathyarchaeota archaeon]